MISHHVNVYGITTESEGPNAFDESVLNEGIPNIFRSDNSKMQRWGKNLIEKMREWVVAPPATKSS